MNIKKLFAFIMLMLSVFSTMACGFILAQYWEDRLFISALIAAIVLCAATVIASLEVAEWAWERKILPDALRLF